MTTEHEALGWRLVRDRDGTSVYRYYVPLGWRYTVVVPSDLVAFLRAQVDEDVRRLVDENARLRTALKAIDDYERPFHSPSEEEWGEYKACPECTRRRENPHFPGNHCDGHYRVMVMKYERLNDDERGYHTAHNLREIARAALEPFKAVAPTADAKEADRG